VRTGEKTNGARPGELVCRCSRSSEPAQRWDFPDDFANTDSGNTGAGTSSCGSALVYDNDFGAVSSISPTTFTLNNSDNWIAITFTIPAAATGGGGTGDSHP
jgi:hypothetical protein